MASNKRTYVRVCVRGLCESARVYANFQMGLRDGIQRGSLAGDIVSENERAREGGGYVPKNRTPERSVTQSERKP
jgi:hypothetical protein